MLVGPSRVAILPVGGGAASELPILVTLTVLSVDPPPPSYLWGSEGRGALLTDWLLL